MTTLEDKYGLPDGHIESDEECIEPTHQAGIAHFHNGVTRAYQHVKKLPESVAAIEALAGPEPTIIHKFATGELHHLGNPVYLELLDYMRELHVAKSAGYSGTDRPDTWSNFREAQNIGLTALQGCMVRLGDKFRRLQNVFRKPDNDQVGEPFPRTAIDLASYALISLCLWAEEHPEEMANFIETIE